MAESFSKAEHLVSDKLKELRAKTKELFSISVGPEISYDLRGLAAGQANYRKNKIRFNRDLLEKYTHEFVKQTVPHEFALWLPIRNSVEKSSLMVWNGNQS